MNGIEEYYAGRAREYESIYLKPERQQDLLELRARVPELLQGKTVLEIACGTGWWTQYVAHTARWILATDFNREVLQLAAMKYYPGRRVRFCRMDAYRPAVIPGTFDACLVAFWWSHVPRQGLPEFLRNLHRCLRPGARVVHLDNKYVEGSSTPIARRDEHGNTYQLRPLSGGRSYEIRKNFPAREEIQAALDGMADDVVFEECKYYWLIHYSLR